MPVDQNLIDEAMSGLNVTAVRPLRDGGQKTVRLVKRGDDELVLKVIAVDSGAPDALRRARREVELLQQVNSPNVVKVASDLLELGDPVAGAAWLEEFLDGEDLSDLLGTQWSWDDVAKMASDIASGLAALHAGKVTHRDLSAANIRRKADGTFVVMDPGFARHPLRSGITVGGQPGTPGYVSPEHLQSYSGAPNPASDIFCVGILMFVTLTTELPIPDTGDTADYLARLSRAEMTDITTLRSDLSGDAVALIKRCLHPQAARRPLNGQQLFEALEALS